MGEKERVIALYNYISEVSKSSKIVKTRVDEEKWNYYLDNLPKHENIILKYKNLENQAIIQEDDIILQIKKPNFIKPLAIEKELLEWITGDWKDYKSKIEIKEKRVIETVIVNDQGENEKISEIEIISEKIKEKIYKELEKRNLWIEEQALIDRTRSVFDNLYIQYLELNKATETLEMLVGNGIVKILNKNIYYPILLKKIKIEFDAENNVITILDTDVDGNFSQEFYTTFLNGIEDVNLEGTLELEKKVQEKNLHPMDKNNIKNFFREFIHKLSAKGQFSEDMEIPDQEAIIIEDRPLIFIRKKEDGIVRAIENIIEKIENFGEIPEQLSELVGIVSVSEKERMEGNIQAEEILFTKESNGEQIEIAEKIERNNAVVVQGPPGTGKTHTIANLLGHFLAQGKNVLVTSHTQKALKVLKEKIPKNIQGLCISILDDDNSDMKRSIESISEKMSSFNSEDLKKDVEILKKDRVMIYEELKKIKEEMFSIKYKESQSIIYNGEGISVKDAGVYLRENENKLNRIPGEISQMVPCPITNEELEFLQKEYKKILEKNEEKEISLGLNDISNFIKPEEFKNLIEKKNTSIEKLKKILNGQSYTLKNEILYIEDQKIIDLKKFREYENRKEIISKELKDIREWKIDAVIAGITNSSSRKIWEDFIEDVEKLYKYSDGIKLKLFKREIKLDGIDIKTGKNLVTELKKGIENPGFIFKTALKKAKENIGNKIILDKEIIKTIEECELVLEYLELLLQKEDLMKSWKLLIENKGGIGNNISEESFIEYLYEYLGEIRYFLNWNNQEKNNFLNKIEKCGIEKENILEVKNVGISMEELRKILTSIPIIEEKIEIGEKALEVLEIQKTFDEYLRKIEKITKEKSYFDKEFENAIKEEDIDKYFICFKTLKEMLQKEESYNRKEEILQKIEKVAKEWAKSLREGEVTGEIQDIYEVWKWKQLSQEIERLAKEPYEELQKKVMKKVETLRRLTLELVEKKAWYHVLCFVEKKENLLVNQALRGWGQTIQKIGKGTGKNAPLYRKQAKEKIAACQKAVPVWIMPMGKVIETLNPAENKFDIVIIDEASQSGINSLILLYMGKKVIIVGDDKQVSPSDVGEKIDKTNTLREKYIKDKIPNDDLYGLRSSIYSIATTTFTPLMLREHFRCVPEIIGYSNKTSYDFKIKPLRESSASKLKPAVINYRVNGQRKDKKKKINEIEAETIVSLIKACLELEEYENASFGVISLLGDEQVELIQKLIVEKIPAIDIEKHSILCGNPSYFQGDERDVVFLSMVDSNDGVGPLAMKGEGVEDSNKKRYNVAVSRAKDQLWIVHSLDIANDLKNGDIRRSLLEYSENPKAFMIEESVKENSDSIFEEEVAKYLYARDYNIVQQWEVGAYRIDMVAFFENKRVAIECDGERWHSTEEQVKQDIERQDILERCGWDFIRIRGSKYFRNPEDTMKEVLEKLEKRGIYPEKDKSENYEIREEELLNKIKSRSFEIMELWKEKGNIEEIEIVKEVNNIERTIKEKEVEIPELVLKIENSKIENKMELQQKKIFFTEKKQIKEENLKEGKNKLEKDIFSLLKEEKLEYIDNRELSGIIWIVYKPEKEKVIERFLQEKDYKYSLDKRGTITTNNRAAWRVKAITEEEKWKRKS